MAEREPKAPKPRPSLVERRSGLERRGGKRGGRRLTDRVDPPRPRDPWGKAK